jgi:hypothetical protein
MIPKSREKFIVIYFLKKVCFFRYESDIIIKGEGVSAPPPTA